MHTKRKMAAKGYWNLDFMPRYLRMKFENWKLFWWKRFWRLESKLVRSQRKEKKDHGKRKVCTEVVNAGVRSGVGIVTVLDLWPHSALFRTQIKIFKSPSKHFCMTSFTVPEEVVVVIKVKERVEETAQRLLLL